MEGLWPLIIMWVLAMLIGGRKKRPPAGTPAPGAGGASGQQGLSGDLLSALQQLRKAEAEAQRRRAGTASPPDGTLPTGLPQASAREARARAYLEERKARGGTPIKRGQRFEVFKPSAERPDRVVRRPVRALEGDDADDSSETYEPEVQSLEGRDYDDEAQRIIEERRQAAERQAVSREALTDAQVARRGGRPDVAIGGAAEHKEWHQKIEGTDAQMDRRTAGARAKPGGALARFADGSARSAVILAEILGRPLGSR